MPYSVLRDGHLLDVVVGRPKVHGPMIPVWLHWYKEHKLQRELLCQVSESRFGWTVVVNGRPLTGLSLVDGFKSRWKAIQYAVAVRPDLNKESKKSNRSPFTFDGEPDEADYLYTVKWSEADHGFVGTVAEFPFLAYISPKLTDAVTGIYGLVRDVLADMKLEGITPPEPGGTDD